MGVLELTIVQADKMGKPLKDKIQLTPYSSFLGHPSIQDHPPPGPAPAPSLTLGVDGVLVKDGLVSGQLVFVNCDSRGGSPTPTLALTLDGSPLDTSNGPLSHAITASPELNTKVLACSAINRAMDKHTVTETVLRVHCESCYP